jgi:spore germination protein KC
MKQSVITVLVVFAVIAVMSNARYFPRMTEITLAEPVFVIAIDRHDNADRQAAGADLGASSSRVTIVYEKIENSDEGGSDLNQKYIDFSTGTSPAAALEVLKKRFPREMAVSTAEYFLIGEEAARDDLERHIDFLTKNNTLRLTSSVFIVRGEAYDASEILIESRTLDILRNYGEYSGINAISSEMMFYELLSEMAGGNSFTVPALVIKENGSERIVVPSGYAVIKDGVLAGFLEAGTARGYNLLTNNSVFSTIELGAYSSGAAGNAATRLENASRRFEFGWDGDTLTCITVNVSFNASVIDSGNNNISYEIEQNRVIFGELQKVIAASKRYGCDFLGIGEALRMRHPLRWERVQAHWNEIYTQVPVKINVTSEVR